MSDLADNQWTEQDNPQTGDIEATDEILPDNNVEQTDEQLSAWPDASDDATETAEMVEVVEDGEEHEEDAILPVEDTIDPLSTARDEAMAPLEEPDEVAAIDHSATQQDAPLPSQELDEGLEQPDEPFVAEPSQAMDDPRGQSVADEEIAPPQAVDAEPTDTTNEELAAQETVASELDDEVLSEEYAEESADIDMPVPDQDDAATSSDEPNEDWTVMGDVPVEETAQPIEDEEDRVFSIGTPPPTDEEDADSEQQADTSIAEANDENAPMGSDNDAVADEPDDARGEYAGDVEGDLAAEENEAENETPMAQENEVEEETPVLVSIDDDTLGSMPTEEDNASTDEGAPIPVLVDQDETPTIDTDDADRQYADALQNQYDDATQAQTYYDNADADQDMAAQLQQRLDGSDAQPEDAVAPPPMDEDAIAALVATREEAYNTAICAAFPPNDDETYANSVPDGSVPYTDGLNNLLQCPLATKPQEQQAQQSSDVTLETAAQPRSSRNADFTMGRTIKNVNHARTFKLIAIPLAFPMFFATLFLVFALGASWIMHLDYATVGGVSLTPVAILYALDAVSIMMGGATDIPFILANAVPLVTTLVYYLALLGVVLAAVWAFFRLLSVCFKRDYMAKRAAFSRLYRTVARAYNWAMLPIFLSILFGQSPSLLGGSILGVGAAMYLAYSWTYARFHNVGEETNCLDGGAALLEGLRKTLVLGGYALTVAFLAKGWWQQFVSSAYIVTHNVSDGGLLALVAYYMGYVHPLWMAFLCLLAIRQLRRTLRGYVGRFAVPDRRNSDKLTDTEDATAFKLSASTGRMVVLLALTFGSVCLQTYGLYGLNWQQCIVLFLRTWLAPIAAQLACAILLSSGMSKQVIVRKHTKKKKRRNKHTVVLTAADRNAVDNSETATAEEPDEQPAQEDGNADDIDTETSYAKGE